VRVWRSDTQEAFVTAIADAFVGTPHRYCHNHQQFPEGLEPK